MKKIYLVLYFNLFFLNVGYTQLTTPSEQLIIAFEDSSGARDTLIVGHYFDPCYLAPCQAIVSPGVDTAFGEVNLPSTPPPGFHARVESTVSEGAPYDTYMKKDIRYNDSACYYSWINFFNDPINFKIRFYNAQYPIIANITIKRDSVYLPDSLDLGCFGNNIAPPSQWARAAYNSIGQLIFDSDWFDANTNPNLSDTLCCSNIDYYVILLSYYWIGIEEAKRNSDHIYVYPNPLTELTTIHIPKQFTSKVTYLSIIDLYGREVRRIENISSPTYTLYRENLKSGLYIYKLIGKEGLLSRGKQVINY